jgi:hypothetical protein
MSKSAAKTMMPLVALSQTLPAIPQQNIICLKNPLVIPRPRP